MHPTVLFYNLENEKGKKIKLLCLQQKLRVRVVEQGEYLKTLGDLISSTDENSFPSEEAAFSDEMLVMIGFYGKQLDTFLQSLRRKKLFVSLKAIFTPDNATWSSVKLRNELEQEHQIIEEQKS